MVKTFLVSLVIDSCLNALDRTITRRMTMPNLLAYHASGRKLSAKFTIEEIIDIRVLMSNSIEDEMMTALRKEVETEIDNYILKEMNKYI